MISAIEKRAMEFEALICEVQAAALDVEAMKVNNKERELKGESLAYGPECFYEASKVMLDFAEKFRTLADIKR